MKISILNNYTQYSEFIPVVLCARARHLPLGAVYELPHVKVNQIVIEHQVEFVPCNQTITLDRPYDSHMRRTVLGVHVEGVRPRGRPKLRYMNTIRRYINMG